MSDAEGFKKRIETICGRAKSRQNDDHGTKRSSDGAGWLFDFVTEIFFHGWWAFISGAAFLVLAALAFFNFLGFDVEYFLAAAVGVFVVIGLAWHFMEG